MVQEVNRVLDQQQNALDGVRSRAGVLLCAATISTSFFGAESVGHRLTGLLPLLSSILFSGVALCVTAVLWPRRRLLFDDSLLYVILGGGPREAGTIAALDVDAAIRSFIEQAHLHLRANAGRIGRLHLLLAAGWALFLAEIIVWLAHGVAA